MSHACAGLHCPGCRGGGNLLKLAAAACAVVLLGGAAAAIAKAIAALIVLFVLAALAAAVAAVWWFVLQIRTGPRGGGLMTIDHSHLETRKPRAVSAPKARPQLEAGDRHLHLHFHGTTSDEVAGVVSRVQQDSF